MRLIFDVFRGVSCPNSSLISQNEPYAPPRDAAAIAQYAELAGMTPEAIRDVRSGNRSIIEKSR